MKDQNHLIALVKLEIFMNSKFFNHFKHFVNKSYNTEIENIVVKNHEGYPFICILYLKSEEISKIYPAKSPE